jgi:hypothetical protein
VRGEVLSDLIGSTLREAFEKENLRPVANPSIDTTGKPENGEIAYTAHQYGTGARETGRLFSFGLVDGFSLFPRGEGRDGGAGLARICRGRL